MTARTLVFALLQFLSIASIGWMVGNFLLDRVDGDAGWPERVLASVAGFATFAVAMMLVHIASGGAVFSSAWPVPSLGAVTVLLLLRRVARLRGVRWAHVLLFSVVLAAIYASPTALEGSSVRTGDPPWHLGWTAQLLGGETVPSGPAPAYQRNAYPWGFHALLAAMVRLVPGSDALIAHESLQWVIIFSIPLGAAVLARRVRPEAGWYAAAACGLIGGFGWVTARGPTFVTRPREAAFGADLVVASPNSVYELLSPPLPREFGLVLLAIAGSLMCASIRDRAGGARAIGASCGLVGLFSVPLFVSAMVWLAATGAISRRPLRWWVTSTGTSVVVFGLWAGPVVANYVAQGGFVNITPRLGMEWSLGTALGSWGLLVPLAVLGLVAGARANTRASVLALAAAALLVAAVARARFGWDLAGNATLLHQGRVWPPAHLIASAFAGVGLITIASWLPLSRRVAAGGALLIVAIGAVSPVLASRGLVETMKQGDGGFVYSNADLSEGSFIRLASEILTPNDVVRVDAPDAIGFYLFQFSGCRLAEYDDPRRSGNDLRIRYRDLAQRWNEQIASGGFEPTHVVVAATTTVSGKRLARGLFQGQVWTLVELPSAPERAGANGSAAVIPRTSPEPLRDSYGRPLININPASWKHDVESGELLPVAAEPEHLRGLHRQ